MPELRVLFIDDDPDGIGPAKRDLERSSYRCKCVSFPGFEQAIDEFQPHIAVVDRMEGEAPMHENLGRQVFQEIWNRWFCPVVVYSAFPDDETDERESHALVRVVKKGQDLTDFRAAVESLAPCAGAIDGAERHIRREFGTAMRDIAVYATEVCADGTELNDVIIRHGRRRVAALMDQASAIPLCSWEQYLHPPVSPDPKLGDIIRLQAGSANDPASFRVILTPSCDMATG